MKYWILLLTGLLLIKEISYAQTLASADSEYHIVAKDGAWCWFADPRAVYHKKSREAIYYGYISSKGDVIIDSRDVKSGERESFFLHKELQKDDHNVPSILFLPDGKILTFYTEHNGRFFTRKSINAEDINAWEKEQVHSFGIPNELITYSHPVMLSEENNRIYLFFRARNKKIVDNPTYINWKQYYTYSDDLGETWSDAKAYLTSGGDYNKIPYLKVVSDNKSKIHFLFTDGHPKISYSSVYHMVYENGQFHQTNGTSITESSALPVEIASVNKVYDAETGKVKSWIWDIALSEAGHPVIAYAQYPSINDHIYHYAYWDGLKWIDQEIVNSGTHITKAEKSGKVLEEHYSGGIVLDHANPKNIYLSRQINGVFEIEHRQFKEGQWKIAAITSDSNSDNIRPYVVDSYTGKHPILLWMNGNYEHYTRYNTKILINEK